MKTDKKMIIAITGLAIASGQCGKAMREFTQASHADLTPCNAWRGGSRKKGGKIGYRRG